MVLDFKTNQKLRDLQTTSLIWAMWSHQIILLIRFVIDYLFKNIRFFKSKIRTITISCLWSQRIKAWTNLNLSKVKKIMKKLINVHFVLQMIFKAFHPIFVICIPLSYTLEKGAGLSFEQTWKQGCFFF